MIRSDHSWLHHLFFRNYFRYLIRKDFNKIKITGRYTEKKLPLLVIGNHFSWWDGFFAYELNTKVFKRRFHLMMLEEQLKRHRYFRKLGAFSIDPGRRSAITSLDYAAKKIESEENMLILFPQGKIESQYSSVIKFKEGWFRILKNARNDIHVIFLVCLTDYFSARKPSLYMYIEEYTQINGFNLPDISAGYNDFYSRSLEHQKSLA